jgi:hypothetical protein
MPIDQGVLTRRQTLRLGVTCSTITVAGCLGGGGSGTEFVVTENDLEDSLEFTHDGITQVESDSGETEGIAAEGTITNVSDQRFSFALATIFLDGDDTELAVNPFGIRGETLGTGVQSDESAKYRQATPEITDPSRVSRVEFLVDER